MSAKSRHVSVYVAVHMHMFSYRFILCVTSMFSTLFLLGKLNVTHKSISILFFNQQPQFYMCQCSLNSKHSKMKETSILTHLQMFVFAKDNNNLQHYISLRTSICFVIITAINEENNAEETGDCHVMYPNETTSLRVCLDDS